MLNAAQQVLDFARAHFGLGILQRHSATQPELRRNHWRASPLTQDFDGLAHQLGKRIDPVGFGRSSLPSAFRRWSVALEMPSMGESLSIGTSRLACKSCNS